MTNDDIIKLIDVLDGTRTLPKLKAIHDKAMSELEAYAKSLEPSTEKEDWERLKPTPPSPVRRVAEVG